MKVKDLSQPLLSGRMGNLIYYVRNGVQCVRRAEVPGKKRKKERSDQQKGVTGRFAIVQAFMRPIAAKCHGISGGQLPGRKEKWRTTCSTRRTAGVSAERGSLWISSILLLRRGPCFCQGD